MCLSPSQLNREPFTYSAIDLEGLEGPSFRLLRLHSGTIQTPIHCTLFDAYLNPELIIPYEALSYTWGGTEKPNSVILNERSFDVTANLHSALQHLRYENEERILWIDAICINQENLEERGHQVSHMGRIYKLAERVIVWLGPAAHMSDLIMDAMECLQRMSRGYACHNWNARDPRWQDMWREVRPLDRSAENLAVTSLLDRDWFKRVWIIQEVAHARSVLIVCGTRSVSARIFSLVLTGTEHVNSHCQAILDIMPGPSKRDSWWGQNRDLRTLIQKFGNAHATDPRDRVYALLGISSDAHDSDILRADYNLTMEDIHKRVVCFWLNIPAHEVTLLSLPPLDLSVISKFPEKILAEDIMHYSVWSGYTRMLKALVEHSEVDVNSSYDRKRSWRAPKFLAPKGYDIPILWAARNSAAMMKALLDCRGIDQSVLTSPKRPASSKSPRRSRILQPKNVASINSFSTPPSFTSSRKRQLIDGEEDQDGRPEDQKENRVGFGRARLS